MKPIKSEIRQNSRASKHKAKLAAKLLREIAYMVEMGYRRGFQHAQAMEPSKEDACEFRFGRVGVLGLGIKRYHYAPRPPRRERNQENPVSRETALQRLAIELPSMCVLIEELFAYSKSAQKSSI